MPKPAQEEDSEVEIIHETSSRHRQPRVLMDKSQIDALVDHPMESMLRRAVALTLDVHKMHMTPAFLDQMTELAEDFAHSLIVALQKFTELQRRHRPSVSDVSLCFSSLHIDHNEIYRLHQSLLAQMSGEQRKYAQKIAADARNIALPAEEPADVNDPSYRFVANEKYEITAVVPQHHARPDYVPSHLPMLPPDYTYHRTPEYMPTITDLKTVRTKLVEESRMTEKWLYVLMKDEKSGVPGEDAEMENARIAKEEENQRWNGSDSDSEREEKREGGRDERDENGVKSVETGAENGFENRTDDTDQPERGAALPPTHKQFDIVLYAKRRIASKQRPARLLEETRKRRAENIFMEAETIFSPYAIKPATRDIADKFELALEAAYEEVMLLVQQGEKEKKRRLVVIEEDKKKRQEERELQADTLEFGALGNMGHSDDSEDDEGFPEFDFPDNPDQKEDESTVVGAVGATEAAEARPTVGKKGLAADAPPATAAEEEESDEDLEAGLEEALGDMVAMM